MEEEKYEKIVVDIAVAHDRLAQVHNELKDVKRIIKRLNVIKSHVEASEQQRARMLVLRVFETGGNGKMSFADAVQAALSKAGPRDWAAIAGVYLWRGTPRSRDQGSFWPSDCSSGVVSCTAVRH
jgi:ATP-dependent Lon protease